MRGIKLIIFDLDGTLVDAFKPVAASLNYAFKKHGYSPQTYLTIKRNVGWGDRNLVGRFVKADDLDRVLSDYRMHHQKALRKGVKLLPGVKGILRDLKKKKIFMAIASNRPMRFTKIILDTLKITPYFQYVLCADKVKHPKPAPDLLRQILKYLSVAPDQACYVGDMTIDAQAGLRARVKTIVVTTGSSLLSDIKKMKPFKIIAHIRGLKISIDSDKKIMYKSTQLKTV